MRAFLLTLACLLAPAAAAAQENILGPCRDGYRWLATSAGGAPVAAYATCREARPLVILACGAGLPELRVAPAPGSPPPVSGGRWTGLLSVDGASPLELRVGASGQFESAAGAFLRVQLTNSAIEAMARGFRAVLDLQGTVVSMHLGASGDVLALVSRRC